MGVYWRASETRFPRIRASQHHASAVTSSPAESASQNALEKRTTYRAH
jgi:hypothetical protein